MSEKPLNYPREMTPMVRWALSRMCFEFIGLAELWRKTGTHIERAAEAEQAFFLHWLLTIVLDDEPNWEDRINAEIARRREMLRK
jgi:hypothetical protein